VGEIAEESSVCGMALCLTASPPHRLPEPPLASRWHFATVPPQRRPPDSPRALRPAGTAAGTTGFFVFLRALPIPVTMIRPARTLQFKFCFGVRSWIDLRDASLQRNRRSASCCRAVSHVGGGCTGRAQSTALVSSFDRAMLMDQHLGHSDGPDHRCGLVLTFLLRSKCNQGRATVRIQWSLGQQAGRHCGMGRLSDPDVMGVLFSSPSNSYG